MSMYCFKKENLYCTWDDSLVGKEVVYADSLGTLYERLESHEELRESVTPSPDSSYPFMDETGQLWRFVYILEPPTDDINNDAVKNAYIQGHTILRRYAHGAWETMNDTYYFDLPGYEYKVSSPTSPRVTNKVLAMWLAKGNGLLLDVNLNSVNTNYAYDADDMYNDVPDGYKVMPMELDEWFEPTENVVRL